jgi:hypothetical protein
MIRRNLIPAARFASLVKQGRHATGCNVQPITGGWNFSF